MKTTTLHERSYNRILVVAEKTSTFLTCSAYHASLLMEFKHPSFQVTLPVQYMIIVLVNVRSKIIEFDHGQNTTIFRSEIYRLQSFVNVQ